MTVMCLPCNNYNSNNYNSTLWSTHTTQPTPSFLLHGYSAYNGLSNNNNSNNNNTHNFPSTSRPSSTTTTSSSSTTHPHHPPPHQRCFEEVEQLWEDTVRVLADVVVEAPFDVANQAVYALQVTKEKSLPPPVL